VPDRPAIFEESVSRNGSWRADFNGWQIFVVESVEPAHRGLQREHEIADEVGAGARRPTIFIWRSQRALIVARGQTSWSNFEKVAAELAEMGWPVLVRRSGGGAFPICRGTVQIAMMGTCADLGVSMDGVYDRLGFLIGSALTDFGIAACVGDTLRAFCDGRHDLVVAGRKIAGLAQHWRLCSGGERCVTAAASVLVEADVGELVGIVDRFHAACGQKIDIRPEAMTTVSCNAVGLSHRNLTAEFSAYLAAAAARTRLALPFERPSRDGIEV